MLIFVNKPNKSDIPVYLVVDYYSGEIISVGFKYDGRTRKRIQSDPNEAIKRVCDLFDDLSEMKKAMTWNVGSSSTSFGSFDESKEQYLKVCKETLENKHLTIQTQRKLKKIIKKIEADLEHKIYVELQRNKFITVRKKYLARLLKNAEYKCQRCGKCDDLTIDHIKPLSLRGKNSFRNFQVLCRSCNSSKGNKTKFS